MNWLRKLLAALGLAALPACSTITVTQHGIPNLAQVEDGVWRGGQPDAEGWAWLAANGVTNVIKLNAESEGSDSEAEAMGMSVFRFPITLSQQIGLSPILSNIFDVALTVIHPGTYVHCERGQDRTGLTVALYRVKHEGWTCKSAEAEMKAHGFHPELLGLSRFWRESFE